MASPSPAATSRGTGYGTARGVAGRVRSVKSGRIRAFRSFGASAPQAIAPAQTCRCHCRCSALV